MYRTLLAALMPLALGLRGTSESLRKALVNVGLELTEQHLYGQQRSEEAPPFMVLMPGLARGCHRGAAKRGVKSRHGGEKLARRPGGGVRKVSEANGGNSCAT